MSADLHRWKSGSGDADANRAFDQAVRAFVSHRPDAGPALARALAADPHHAGALALKGFALLLLARSETVAEARACLRAARAAIAFRGGTDDERHLVQALSAACSGRFAAAANDLDHGFASRPTELLPFKLAHALRFMVGDSGGMLSASTRMMDAWRPDAPGAGFLLGCHAFALEERGFFAEAERAGRAAVEIEEGDAWGLHAVSHVYETRRQTRAGVAWLEATRATWTGCNNFAFHVAWHLALLHLRSGGQDRVLAIYDAEVMPRESDDFRDLANAVSLLWRLNHAGVDVGRRWEALSAAVRRRRADATLIFAALHNLIALRALNDAPAMAELTAALAAKAAEADEQGVIARRLGLPLARILAGGAARPDATGAAALKGALAQLGGSNVQRDLSRAGARARTAPRPQPDVQSRRRPALSRPRTSNSPSPDMI